MGRCRVVRPEEVRLPLSDGDFIDVKKELNAGEFRTLLNSQFKDQAFGSAAMIDRDKLGISKLLAYILRWSFIGFDGLPLPYSIDMSHEARRDTLDALEPETYAELIKAIDDHELKVDAEVAARKNVQDGAIKSSLISSSAA